jgi:phosphomannomutase
MGWGFKETERHDRRGMPEISRFYAILIAMFWAEHNPPLFHARYGEQKAAIEIDTLRVLYGSFPPRALGLVVEWASQHKEERMRNWEDARNKKPLRKIEFPPAR